MKNLLKTRPKWWRIPAFLVAMAAFTMVSSGVWAYWSSNPGTSGSGAASAISVNAGATPTAVPAGTTVTVNWAASTLSDGTAVTGYAIKRYNATTLVAQTITTGCAGTITALTCTETGLPTGQWKYSVTPKFSTNWTGAESGLSSVVYTDPTPPTNAITVTNVTGGAALNGTTVYYRGASAGSFTLTNAVTDVGSGPASSSTAALGGTSTGWTTTPSTVSTPTGGPYVSTTFSWTAGATTAPTEVVTGRDLANNTTAATLTFVNDSTLPTGTVSYNNSYQPGKFVTVTTTGTDADSGLASAQLQRASGRLINGTCTGLTAFANIGPVNPPTPYTDNAVVNSWCYAYRYVLTDLVGNVFTATSPNVAVVDYAGAVRYATTGILSQLRFGDSSVGGNVTAVDSVGSNNGKYFGGPIRGANGDPLNDSDTAVALDGSNDYIQVASPTGLPTGAASRSVELWFKTSSQLHQSLFTYGSFAVNQEFGLWIEPAGKGLTGWGWGGGNDPTFTSATSVEDGKWHQVVETYNGSAIALYVDGVSLGSQAMTRNTVVDAYGLQIGDVVEPADPNSAFPFNGSLDEFSIYSTALTQTDVTNHYQLGANTGADASGPTGGSVSASGLGGTGGLYSTSTALNLSAGPGTDPSGLDLSASLAFESVATLTSPGTTDGACGTFGAFTLLDVNPPTSAVDNVADNQCYIFQYAVPDTLGNYSTYSTGVIKVDTSAPPTPTFVFSGLNAAYATGSILYYRPSGAGAVTISTPVTDPTSGISTWTFPTITGGWSVSGSGATRSYSWTGTATASGVESLVVGNNAGQTSTGSFTLTIDSTNPTGGSITSSAATQTAHTTPITFATGTDTGSGIFTWQLQRSTATYSTSTSSCGTQGLFANLGILNPTSIYNDTSITKGCYDYQLVVTDRVGNQTIYTSPSQLKVTQ